MKNTFIKDFKQFALRGNIVDLAIGIVIGAAFGKIVSSLVSDILMPPIGLLIGGINFTDIKLILKAAEEGKEAVTLNLGNFVQSLIDFTIIAFALFVVIKAMMRMKRKEETVTAKAPEPEPSKSETLLTEIRDLLKK
ncbi:MAG: large-conductance mechanosensitive channel protein MscL [Bacteroidales bacterium]|nr:large-conductance mechanosensitive channel protein MscL [Bacteroidales bacterium]